MEKDYYTYVIAVYEKKKGDHDISRRLIGSSPAPLRDLCLENCEKKMLRKDEKTLADFFGEPDEKHSMSSLIKNFDTDRFKPLIRYLKKETTTTNLLNIEILAWLIDAPARPYHDKTDYVQLVAELDKHAIPILAPTVGRIKPEGIFLGSMFDTDPKIPAETNTPVTTTPVTKAEPKKKRRMLLITLFYFIFFGTSTSIYWMATQPQFCMYWAGDHYEPISCNQKMEGVLVVAYDSARVHHFKKITRADTLTYSSIGHVWCSKINNVVEFFTSSGRHPVQIYYELRPATAYMIDTHAKKTKSQ